MILLNRAVKPKYSGNFAGGGGSPPAWLAGAALLSWTQIVGSAMANLTVSVNPGSKPAANILDVWSGYCFDRTNNIAWLGGSGGHDDYWGNQVLNFLLNVPNPVWAEVLASTSGFTTPSNATRYSDGSVPSAHTYFCSQYIHSTRRAMRFTGGAYSTVGFPKRTNEAYSVDDGQWEAIGTYPDFPVDVTAPATCKHYTSEDVFIAANNNNLYLWEKLANTITAQNPTMPVSLSESASAHDHSRGKILFYGGAEAAASHLYDIAGKTFTAFPITGDLPAPIGTGGNASVTGSAYINKGYGLGYDQELNSYLVRLGDAGGAVYEVDPLSGVSTVLSTTGGGSIAATAVVSGNAQNIYTKWQYVSDLCGFAGWLYTPSHASDSWFLTTKVPT